MEHARSLARSVRPTILLVEDDERVRGALTQLLHWTGEWEVVGAAADEASALKLAAALQPTLVLLDLWLPDGNGLDLIPLLQALQPPPLVLVLTITVEAAVRQRALELGAHGYLLKTSSPIELLAALRALLGNKAG